MFIFVRDGRYVTATNKFWFWISVLAGIAGAAMSFSLMKAAGQIPLGIILTLLFAGCAVLDCMFLAKGRRSVSITACGYGIAATLIPFLLQCVNLQGDDYIPMAGCAVLTVIANVWALVGSRKNAQVHDASVKDCAALRGGQSRPFVAALYVLAAAGIALALIAVLSGSLPEYL